MLYTYFPSQEAAWTFTQGPSHKKPSSALQWIFSGVCVCVCENMSDVRVESLSALNTLPGTSEELWEVALS